MWVGSGVIFIAGCQYHNLTNISCANAVLVLLCCTHLSYYYLTKIIDIDVIYGEILRIGMRIQCI